MTSQKLLDIAEDEIIRAFERGARLPKNFTLRVPSIFGEDLTFDGTPIVVRLTDHMIRLISAVEEFG